MKPSRARRSAAAIDPLHHEVELAGVGHAVGDVPDDRRMAELREHLNLAMGALDLDGITPRHANTFTATAPPVA